MVKDNIKTRFLKDVKSHTMSVEMDNGVHRSLKFSRDNSSTYYFRINTWPGHLCISGDMGTYVFARLPDMFEFFRGDELRINEGYWAEKLQSISCFGSKEGRVKEYDEDATIANIKEMFRDRRTKKDTEKKKEIIEDLRGCSDTREATDKLYHHGIEDPWDYVSQKYTSYMQWSLYAIRWAIMQYDKPKAIAA